jgi:hypothetical protein
MNRRTIAAVLALGLAIGVAGIATARQAGEPQATEKSKFRAQVVKLRTAASKKQAEGVRAAIDAKKRTYVDLSSKLAEKRLDLEEAEIPYRGTR